MLGDIIKLFLKLLAAGREAYNYWQIMKEAAKRRDGWQMLNRHRF